MADLPHYQTVRVKLSHQVLELLDGLGSRQGLVSIISQRVGQAFGFQWIRLIDNKLHETSFGGYHSNAFGRRRKRAHFSDNAAQRFQVSLREGLH
jgi:hypothetical protein